MMSKQVRETICRMTIADIDLLVAEEMEVVCFVRNQRLSLDKHVSEVARLSNYHAQAVRCICHLLSPELAQMLAFSLILSRIHHCTAPLRDAPTNTILRLQCCLIVVQVTGQTHAKPLLYKLHWLSVQLCVTYKTALLTCSLQYV